MLEAMQVREEVTLANWLGSQGASADLTELIQLFAEGAEGVAETLRTAALSGNDASARRINVQGEEQKKLDIISHDIMVEKLSLSSRVAALVSEEMPDLIVPEQAAPAAPFIVCFDPLDGSSNLEVNGAVGSIFSVLQRRSVGDPCDEAQVLAAARDQRAAGYVLYGPATLMVLTTGKCVASFALDAETGLRSSGIDHVVLRIPGIYGPGRWPLQRLRAGTPVIDPAEAPPSNRIHAEDLAEVALLAAERGALGQVYHVGDGQPTTMTDYFYRVADHFGIARPPAVSLAEAERVFTPAQWSFIAGAKRIRVDRAFRELGFSPRYTDLSQALAEAP